LEGCLETFTESFDHRQQFTMDIGSEGMTGIIAGSSKSVCQDFNADGSLPVILARSFDVTDRKEAEQAVATVSGRLIERKTRNVTASPESS